jgi:hypothetical protein
MPQIGHSQRTVSLSPTASTLTKSEGQFGAPKSSSSMTRHGLCRCRTWRRDPLRLDIAVLDLLSINVGGQRRLVSVDGGIVD